MAAEDTVVNFVIGIFVSLGASFMDALGLNILKLDHVREAKRQADQQRGDCGRPLWHLGLYTYIGSQLIGSTIALNYLKTQWVAPLGSVALIYNFIFAKILVGTKITRKDVLGTCVVVASVIWIVVFGGMYNGDDPEESISLERLKTLFTRPIFIIYFATLNIITLSGLAFAIWSLYALKDDKKKRQSQLFVGMKPKKMRRIVGLMFSLDGGLLASETLLLAKSGVKLFTLSISSQVNQFTDNTSRFILLALLLTAILQVYCLNSALKLYSSVVVVPVFYGTYTALGLVNTIIYLDEIGNYPGWAIALVFAGIGVLIYGVYLLSSKPDPSHPQDDEAGVPQEMSVLSAEPTWLSAKEEKESASQKLQLGKDDRDAGALLGEGSGSQSQLPVLLDAPEPYTPSQTGWFQQRVARIRLWARRAPDTSPRPLVHLAHHHAHTSPQITPPLPVAQPFRSSDSDALRHRPNSSLSDTHSLYATHPVSPPLVDSTRVRP